MVVPVFLVLVFCFSTLTETVRSHTIIKREAEKTSELQLENDLRRVKRLKDTDAMLLRVKRMKRDEHYERELSRIKRLKRSLKPGLSRVKRTKRASEVVLPELSRAKRFKDLEVDSFRLTRVKRLKRSPYKTLTVSHYEPNLSRMKRSKRSIEFALHEKDLSRVKRFHDPNTIELSQVNRLKRSAREKRIPNVHKIKRNRNKYVNYPIGTQKRHFKALHGHLDRNVNLNTVKQELSRQSGALTQKRKKNRGTETLKQRLEKRTRNKHKRRMKHKNMKMKKHHIQSHRLNKKNIN
ncbi:unnamed protein product [Mytilus edulis]|uniref:Uncharacterized protein n=1 Tax=Mytilus edulis TaxID=6550 RepID=A0A8S3TT72_MYTED|nr:unnamed protein product [Mytilus edulis]